jgi:hypothetical protein
MNQPTASERIAAMIRAGLPNEAAHQAVLSAPNESRPALNRYWRPMPETVETWDR